MSTVLGIIGSTLPPLATSKYMKRARDSLVCSLKECIAEIPEIDYALVTMDRETGPWICNYLRQEGIPYIAIEAQQQLWTGKLRYWRNQAVDHILVPMDPDDCHGELTVVALAPFGLPSSTTRSELAKQPKVEEVVYRRLGYVLRNQWVINQSDTVFLCCLPAHEQEEDSKSMRFYFKRKLLALTETGKKASYFWVDRQVAVLLRESHAMRKRNQHKKKYKQTMLAKNQVCKQGFNKQDFSF